MKTKNTKHADIFSFQPSLRPAPPKEDGPKEYREYRDTFIEMNRILESGIEHKFILDKIKGSSDISPFSLQNRYSHLKRSFRFALLLAITGDSKRELSIRVNDSLLLKWFTTFDLLSKGGKSKSSIDRYEKIFTEEEITGLIHQLNQSVAEKEQARLLILEDELDFSRHWVDSTCIKANIHFPVDWVLLRDAARSLINSIEVIRSHGLKHRISEPQEFIRRMNSLVMQMTHTNKKKNGPIRRKMILRRMNRLMNTISAHGQRYHELLSNHWEESDLSEKETQVVLHRLGNILNQIPGAIRQAKSRIIDGKLINNSEKILSLYEEDVHVLVRGKSGAAVEFGNGLYLSENEDGLITDWQFLKGQPPADSNLVAGSVKRLKSHYSMIRSYAGDRGFSSFENRELFEQEEIYDAICPKSVSTMEKRLCEGDFVRLQKRRANTEARISILKNNYIGETLKSKGYKHRQLRIGISILAHNLWLLATFAAENRREQEEELRRSG